MASPTVVVGSAFGRQDDRRRHHRYRFGQTPFLQVGMALQYPGRRRFAQAVHCCSTPEGSVGWVALAVGTA